MDRLTNKKLVDLKYGEFLSISKEEYRKQVHEAPTYKEIYTKLGKLEDLEEQLGCPLEVVFKAIENGIVIIGDLKENGDITLWLNTTSVVLIGEKRDFEEPRLIKYDKWAFSCESGSYSGCVSLDDYGKTWWLASDKESE